MPNKIGDIFQAADMDDLVKHLKEQTEQQEAIFTFLRANVFGPDTHTMPHQIMAQKKRGGVV